MKNFFEDDTVVITNQNDSQQHRPFQSSNMKVLLLFLGFVVLTTSARDQNQYAFNNNGNDDGQYRPQSDNSGQYVPDDSGRYIPDHSGDYVPDGLGGYFGDNTGNYQGDGSGAYTGQNGGGGAYKGQFGGKGSGSGSGSAFGSGSGFGSSSGNLGSIKSLGSFAGISSTNLLGSGSSQAKQTIKPNTGYGTGSGSGAGYGAGSGAYGQGSGNVFGNSASATSQVLATSSKSSSVSAYGAGGGNPNLSGSRYDQGRYADGRWKIIRQSGDVDTDGYHWEYETENGITAEESGKLANKGTDLEAMKAKGFFQYTGPDNVLYHISYTADENGFIPEGNHIPTPPPIPAQIIKSLEYLKTIGKL